MTEDEITAILSKAHGCVESECAVNDVDDLITELKEQQTVLNTRLETIMNVVAHLQAANAQEKRKTDDVRAIVNDMLRVFTTSVSSFGGGWCGGIDFCVNDSFDECLLSDILFPSSSVLSSSSS